MPFGWPSLGLPWKLQVKIQKLSIEFDLVAGERALRRILIAEVLTVGVEYVYVWNNTSVMVDEVFSHRLGLIPLNVVDPALLGIKSSPNDQATDRNTIVFKLQFDGYPGRAGGGFSARPPAPTIPETVLVKPRPGQVIEMETHAVKGVGKDKFSTVATASYRLLPHVILDEANPVPPHLATRFRDCFSPGVIKRGVRGETIGREVLRHPDLAKYVKLARVRDHFILNVGSEGPYESQRLPLEVIRVMREKISTLKSAAEALRT
ncbi:DNA-directed RNA polymerase [Lactifluus subvellereus]|nr:DNA-directed RNA polymerase [Lactifluus subvellereus]